MDKIGFWNVRGMNRSRKRKENDFFLKNNNNIGLFSLLETKIRNKALHRAAVTFDSWCISTDNGYNSGGRICIVWQPSTFRVQFIEYNAQFGHMKVESLLHRHWFFLTFVYAFNGIHDREVLWLHLRKLEQQSQGPWAVAGDFNCVLSPTKRVGGSASIAEIGPFKSCVEDCGLVDIKSIGARFTWNNKQKADSRIYSRLDRFLVNKHWSEILPESYANFLPEGVYDHTPCLVSQSQEMHRKRSFKYYSMWGASDKFLPLLKQHWNAKTEGTHMFKLVKNLKMLKPVLKQLNRDSFSDIEVSTEALENQVKMLQEELGSDPTNVAIMEEEHRCVQELALKMEARASFLAQKSKQNWFKEGDTNSAYFHGIIKGRRTRNKVIEIEDMNGFTKNTPKGIQTAFLEYYKSLLGSSQETKHVHRRIVDQGPRCNEHLRDILMTPVNGKEIKEALFSIPDIKSPGPDGYTSKFFKDSWLITGESVIEAVSDYFKERKLLQQLNATTLVLIPKTDRPTSVLQFRPIACCNMIYKVISKILCSRLAQVLPYIIDQNQGAFIQGRNIQENILIFHDLIRLYERPNTSARCMFKMDLQKAYDMVEWRFVEQLLDHLNFPEGFKLD
ncbi:hypothetical protein vseg_011814 [Gypsophila vaccaria]